MLERYLKPGQSKLEIFKLYNARGGCVSADQTPHNIAEAVHQQTQKRLLAKMEETEDVPDTRMHAGFVELFFFKTGSNLSKIPSKGWCSMTTECPRQRYEGQECKEGILTFCKLTCFQSITILGIVEGW